MHKKNIRRQFESGQAVALPCKRCNECEKYCPKQLDITGYISLYNKVVESKAENDAAEYIKTQAFEKQPQNCSHCRLCESVCPEKIKISDMMMDLSDVAMRS